MLTKMPKVGDVLIANERAVNELCDITEGKEYKVTGIDDGDAYITDDVYDERYIDEDRFQYFSLKADSVNVENIGTIEEIEFETTEVNSSDFCAKYHVITLTVDDAGLASVRKLARESAKQKSRKHLQAKIDALQAELNAL